MCCVRYDHETKWVNERERIEEKMEIQKEKKKKKCKRENRAQTIQQVLYLEEINSIICAAITAPYILKVFVFTPMKNRVRGSFFLFSLLFLFYSFSPVFCSFFSRFFSLFGLVVSVERVLLYCSMLNNTTNWIYRRKWQ